jgi:hypothetical protein
MSKLNILKQILGKFFVFGLMVSLLPQNVLALQRSCANGLPLAVINGIQMELMTLGSVLP